MGKISKARRDTEEQKSFRPILLELCLLMLFDALRKLYDVTQLLGRHIQYHSGYNRLDSGNGIQAIISYTYAGIDPDGRTGVMQPSRDMRLILLYRQMARE